MSSRVVSFGELTEEQRRVHQAGQALHRDGASPAGALELLAAIMEDRTWGRVTDPHGRSFEGRFTAFVEAKSPFGLGYPVAQLRRLLELQHPHEEQGVASVAARMATMRQQVRQLLGEAIEPALSNGGDRRSENLQLSGTQVKRDAAAITARLKRDNPALADQVVRGEVSANAAAREMGWRHPRIVVSSPDRVAEALRRTMPAEDIARLVAILGGEA